MRTSLVIDGTLPQSECHDKDSFSVANAHAAYPSPTLRMRSGWGTLFGDSEALGINRHMEQVHRPERLSYSSRWQAQRRPRMPAASFIRPCNGRLCDGLQFDPFRAEGEPYAANRGLRPRGGLTPGYCMAAFQAAGWASSLRLEGIHTPSHHTTLLNSTHCRTLPRGEAA